MPQIKTMNKIAAAGLSVLDACGFAYGDAVENPDGILVRSADLHKEQFAPETLAIARAGAGTNNIPIDRCTEQGIVVFNTPGANAEAVKELAVCALLLASRDIVGGCSWVASLPEDGDVAKAVEKGKAQFVGPEIMGKSLGIIGLGAIGAKLANAALELGMIVYGYDPFLSVDAAWRLSSNVRHAASQDEIFQNCDYISVHVPYMDSTHHMINAETISKMKDGVRLLNLARGELVDDEAILQALSTGKVARYITDFPNNALVRQPGVVAMPHIGASTPESEENCAQMAAREIVDYIENGNITNSVNLPAVKLDRMGVARICVIHKNVPRMINRFLDLIGIDNINVEHMINKPRGDVAYTMIDTDRVISPEIIKIMSDLNEVMRVRVIRY